MIWSEVLALVSKVRPPVAKRSSDGAGEVTLATSSTSNNMLIPDWMRGCYCEFTAHASSVEVLFGVVGDDVVYGQASDVTADVLTVHANTGRRIVDGTTRSWLVPSDPLITYMAWEASGSGTLHIGLASQRITDGDSKP